MKTTTLTCVNCPLGCVLEAECDAAGEAVRISGNECPRGIAYAKTELRNPVRVFTSTVRIAGAPIRVVPVKTAEAVPKARLMDIARALRDVCLDAPVKTGDVVFADVCGTGVDVVTTRSVCTG